MKQRLERGNKMKKNKGFTLIELLAVIVILAIIALIAVPTVMNIINKANKSAFKDSAYGIIKAGELFYTDQLLENAGLYADKTFTFPNDIEGLEIKRSKPTGGYVTVNKEGQVSMAVTNGKYCATKNFEDNDVKISDNLENCEISNNSGDILDNSWPIEWNTMEVLENTSGNYSGVNFVRVSSLAPSAIELASTQILANLDGTTLTFTYRDGQNIDGVEMARYVDSSTGNQVLVASIPAAGNYDGMFIESSGLYVMNMGHEDNGGMNADVVLEKIESPFPIEWNSKDVLEEGRTTVEVYDGGEGESAVYVSYILVSSETPSATLMQSASIYAKNGDDYSSVEYTSVDETDGALKLWCDSVLASFVVYEPGEYFGINFVESGVYVYDFYTHEDLTVDMMIDFSK